MPFSKPDEKSSSFFDVFDSWFTIIRNVLKEKTSEAETSCKFTDEEIANAQTIFKQCLHMDLESFLQSGQAPELKNSLSIMLASNSFPSPKMVEKATKFLAEFDELINKYESAQRDLKEARENDDSIGELKATLKQLSLKFMPVRNLAEAVDREIERQESVLVDRKSKKARLRERLEDLAGLATCSKQALLCAEQNLMMSSIKKEKAEKVIGDFERSWSSLKTSMAEEETKKLGNSQSIAHSLFTWNIDSLSALKHVKEIQSDDFDAGGHKWRIIICAKRITRKRYLTFICIEPADWESFSGWWTINANFRLSVINKDNEQIIVREAKHTFDESEFNWGFYFQMPFSRAYYTVNDSCIVTAEVWCDEQDKEEPNYLMEEAADSNLEKSSSSFAEFDSLFTDIRNLIELQTFEADNSCKLTDNEIVNAQTILNQCLHMDLQSFLLSVKTFEFKNSLSIMLSSNSFCSRNMVNQATKFVAEFDKRCIEYEAAQRYLSEPRDNDDLVGELKATLKQLYSKFMLVRNQAVAFQRETERLEGVLAERKAKKEWLRMRLQDFAIQATDSIQALLRAEQNMKMSPMEKEQAEKIIDDFRSSWDSLKIMGLFDEEGTSEEDDSDW